MPETAEFLSVAERNVQFSSSDRRRQSIPGPCSGHWKCSIAKCSMSAFVLTNLYYLIKHYFIKKIIYISNTVAAGYLQQHLNSNSKKLI